MTGNVRGIDHVGITVPDLDAATAFFTNAFDARIVYDTHLRTDPPQQGDQAEAMLGLAAEASVVAIRLLRIANGASVELFEVRNPCQAQPSGVGDLGLHHIALYCDDLDATLKRVTAAGATRLAGPNSL